MLKDQRLEHQGLEYVPMKSMLIRVGLTPVREGVKLTKDWEMESRQMDAQALGDHMEVKVDMEAQNLMKLMSRMHA
jgi:hypothetical protein